MKIFSSKINIFADLLTHAAVAPVPGEDVDKVWLCCALHKSGQWLILDNSWWRCHRPIHGQNMSSHRLECKKNSMEPTDRGNCWFLPFYISAKNQSNIKWGPFSQPKYPCDDVRNNSKIVRRLCIMYCIYYTWVYL